MSTELRSGVVERIEADPNRSAFVALARYDKGEGRELST